MNSAGQPANFLCKLAGLRQPERVRVFPPLLTLILFSSLVQAQEQERKLIDRLLRPDMTLQNSAQNKKFVTASVALATGRVRPTGGHDACATQVFRIWAARKSRLGVRDLFAVRPAGGFENDGRNEPRSAAVSREVGGWPNERRRSTALPPRKTRTRKIHAGRSPGIACAFWFEPGKCVAAGRGRSVVESR